MMDHQNLSSRLTDGFFVFENLNSTSTKCDTIDSSNTIFASYIIFIVTLGLIGNIIIFSTIVLLKEYKITNTNWYILHLTISNTMFLMMLPFTAHSEFNGSWNFSLPLCKFKEAILFINYYASIYFLVVMSFDQYLTVAKPITSTKWLAIVRSPTTSYAISLFGWIISGLLCIQLFTYSTINGCKMCAYAFPSDTGVEAFDTLLKKAGVEPQQAVDYPKNNDDDIQLDNSQFDLGLMIDILKMYSANDIFSHILDNTTSTFNDGDIQTKTADVIVPEEPQRCRSPDSTAFKNWMFGNFIGAFCFPLLLISFFYGTIVKKTAYAKTSKTKSKKRSYKRRATLFVISLVGLFIISWLPFYVDKFAKFYGLPLSAPICKNLEICVRALAYLSSALNPYFYIFFRANSRRRVGRVASKVRRCLPFPSESKKTSFRRSRPCVETVDEICDKKQEDSRHNRATNATGKDQRTLSVAQKTEGSFV